MGIRRFALLGCLLVAGCAAEPRPALPDPTVIAPHEWEHGPPWAANEQPWVPPPPVTYGGPGAWWPGFGLGSGVFVGRGYWWRGHGGYHGGYRGGYRGGGGRRGGRR